MIRFQFPQGHPMARVAYTPDSLAVVTAQAHTGVFVRDRFTGATIREFPLSGVPDYYQLAISRCGRFLAVGGSKQLVLYDLSQPGATAAHWQVASRAFCVGSSLLRWVSQYGQLSDVHDQSLDPPVNWATREVRLSSSGTVIAMSPDGRAGVAVRQRGKPQLVELNSGQTVAELSFPLRRMIAGVLGFAVFSPDSTKLALCVGEKLAVFDLADFDWAAVPDKPRQLYPLCELDRPDPTAGGTVKDRATEHWLPPLAFTPDGRSFLTLDLRERVQLFDAKSGAVAEQWGWRMEDVTCLAVAPDGMTACAGGRRGKLTVWDLC